VRGGGREGDAGLRAREALRRRPAERTQRAPRRSLRASPSRHSLLPVSRRTSVWFSCAERGSEGTARHRRQRRTSHMPSGTETVYLFFSPSSSSASGGPAGRA